MGRALSLALRIGLAAAGAGCGLVYDLSKLGPGAEAARDGDTADAAPLEAGPRTCPAGRGAPMIDTGAFCIDATESTNAEYAAFLAATTVERPTLPPACAFKQQSSPASTVPGERDQAVRNVDWCDAFAYCVWSGKRLCGTIGGGSLRRATAADAAVSEWASVCQGGLAGVSALVGGVAEWVDACETDGGTSDECEVMGGSFLAPAEASCTSVGASARGALRADQGIRCCAP